MNDDHHSSSSSSQPQKQAKQSLKIIVSRERKNVHLRLLLERARVAVRLISIKRRLVWKLFTLHFCVHISNEIVGTVLRCTAWIKLHRSRKSVGRL